MAEGQVADRVGRIVAGVEERYAASAPYRQDRELAAELALEARPAVECLVAAVGSEPAERASVLDHHEALAMVTLLGRRAGILGATPTAMVGLMRSIFLAFAEEGTPLPEEQHHELVALALEGFVAGREERLVDEGATRSADAQVIVRVADKCLVLFLAGELSAEMLERTVDRFGREMLKADASAALVDFSRLRDPGPGGAAEVFGAHATARMLGGQCVFVGASEEWLAAAKEGRVDLDMVHLAPTFEEGLRQALGIAGWELRRISWLPGPLRTLLRNR